MAEENKKPGEYNVSNIETLEPLQAIRKRPGMYIGDAGKEGLHHLVYEIVDNSIDEAQVGYGEKIIISRFFDQKISVEDEGRGIPVGIHEKTGVSGVETVLTVVHSGGKFDSDAYSVSGGLHGVGASVVTALSEYIIAEVCKDGKQHSMKIAGLDEAGHAIVEQSLAVIGDCNKNGTRITFKADPIIFTEGVIYDDEKIILRLKNSAYLSQGIRCIYRAEVSPGEWVETELYSKDGLVDYVNDLISEKNQKIISSDVPFYIEKDGSFQNTHTKEMKNVKVKFSFAFANGHSKCSFSYVNNIPTKDGGPHETAMFTTLRRVLAEQSAAKKLDKKIKGFTLDDIQEGLVAVLAVYTYEPLFEGQTKSKLGTSNSHVTKAVNAILKEYLTTYFEENPKVLKAIVGKIEVAKRARESAERSKTASRLTSSSDDVGLAPTKLADCSGTIPEQNEVYLVEGDSAAGSAKNARDSSFQAILSLQGKIPNMFNPKNVKKMLRNNEIASLIKAIGAGVGKDFDITKVRYHKVINFTDADVDGGHINFLLGIFFLTQMRPLIEEGYLYTIVPPLHKLSKGDITHYFYTNEERDAFNKTKEGMTGKWIATRFKGLGEMNVDQIEETGLNPETRNLKKLVITDNDLMSSVTEQGLKSGFTINEMMTLLGGDNSSTKRWFLMNFSKEIAADI